MRRDARQALGLTIVLMLVASPLLWAHYFSLLLIPLALRRPRLSVVWALPLLMWLMPPRQPVYGSAASRLGGRDGSLYRRDARGLQPYHQASTPFCCLDKGFVTPAKCRAREGAAPSLN